MKSNTKGVQLANVAIVGRPNVGKSTLMNRVMNKRLSIVEEKPGVTRDRVKRVASWVGTDFNLVDTGGWKSQGSSLDKLVSVQVEKAIEEADVVVVVADGIVGITVEDQEIAKVVKRSKKPTLLAANKIDSVSQEVEAYNLTRLGLGNPMLVSSLHGRGVGELLDAVVNEIPEHLRNVKVPSNIEIEKSDKELAIAIVGRPNVGKSTLFNCLDKDDRSVVHDSPGTTTDTVDTYIENEFGSFRLLDTAGMRRKSRVDEATEHYSIVRALKAIDEANIALLVIAANEGVTHQDQRLAERIDLSGSPVIVILNKWELLNTQERLDITAEVKDKLQFLGYSSIVKISALTGRGVHKLFPVIEKSIEAYGKRVPTAALNRAVLKAQTKHPAPSARVLYAVQGAVDPPTITLFADKKLHPTWLRYLEKQIKQEFDLGATPVKLRVRLRNKS